MVRNIQLRLYDKRTPNYHFIVDCLALYTVYSLCKKITATDLVKNMEVP